jgi:hypothetical protein
MFDDAPWGDDGADWWHQLDLEMQEREEQERIDECNDAIAELQETDHAE